MLENRDVTILALANIAETRDAETGAHLERVREYCRILAMDLSKHGPYQDEIDGDYIEAIYSTSPLHDIGKVGIPDEILRKSGPLTEAEYAKMKEHTLIGGKTMSATLKAHPEASFLRVARDIAESHHERWDGGGYPHGLSGTQIPLCGRIIALADVYDALVSKRVYKEAYDHEQVQSMIVAEKGKQFDPVVVDAFVRSADRFREIHACFEDRAPSLNSDGTHEKPLAVDGEPKTPDPVTSGS